MNEKDTLDAIADALRTDPDFASALGKPRSAVDDASFDAAVAAALGVTTAVSHAAAHKAAVGSEPSANAGFSAQRPVPPAIQRPPEVQAPLHRPHLEVVHPKQVASDVPPAQRVDALALLRQRQAIASPSESPVSNTASAQNSASPTLSPKTDYISAGERSPVALSSRQIQASLPEKTEMSPMTNTATNPAASAQPIEKKPEPSASQPSVAARPAPAPVVQAPIQPVAAARPPIAGPKPASSGAENARNTVEAALEKAEVAWKEVEADAVRATAANAAVAKAGVDTPAAKEAAAVALRKAEIAWKAAVVEMELVANAKGARNAPKAWSKEVEVRTDEARRNAEVALKAAGVSLAPVVAKAPAKEPAVKPSAKPAPEAALKPKRRRKTFTALRISFALAVLLPTVLVGLYYLMFASDQYRSEVRFAVRGTQQPMMLESLGLAALPGASSQSSDAYIVIDYIHSKQVLRDIQQKLGVDVRQYFAKSGIDFWYRIDPNMPLDEFIDYWRWMIDASFNSTTSITTFEITAFTADDAQQIAAAVLKVSDQLVNELSAKARVQLIQNAEGEVQRTEDRLAGARKVVESFRNKIQAADPSAIAESDQKMLSEMEGALIELKTRKSVLMETVDPNAPSVRVIDREINARSAELELKRKSIGSGTSASPGTSLSSQLSEYNALMLEQEFAEKAYTTALASLETSQAEARRQERYFAIVVAPSVPEIALYPSGMINTLVAFASFCVLWLIGYLVVQSIRDHTI